MAIEPANAQIDRNAVSRLEPPGISAVTREKLARSADLNRSPDPGTCEIVCGELGPERDDFVLDVSKSVPQRLNRLRKNLDEGHGFSEPCRKLGIRRALEPT